MSFKYSRYAQRFLKQTGTVQLMDDLAARAPGTIMLGGGNPAAIPSLQPVFRKAMQEIMSESDTFDRMLGDYSGPKGYSQFIQALAAYLREQVGLEVTDKNIALTNGSQTSFGVLFNSFAGVMENAESKKILIPMVPEYIGYADQGVSGESLVESKLPKLEMLPNDFYQYHIDFDALDIDDRFGAMVVSRPTNPTGNVIADKELEKLAMRAEEASIPLIIDGAYGLPFPAIVHTEAKVLWSDNIVLCLSLSKLGLPGLRTGIVVANEQIIELMRRANAIGMLAPGNVGAYIGGRLLQNRVMQQVCDKIVRPYYETKRQFVLECIKQKLSDIPLKLHRPDGAFFLWLWFRDLPISSQELYERLREKNVMVLAGEHFYPGIHPDQLSWRHRYECIRISYAAPECDLTQGIETIAETVRALYL